MCHLPNPSACLPTFIPSFFPSLPMPPHPIWLQQEQCLFTVDFQDVLVCTHLSLSISERNNMQCAMSGLSSFLFKCPHSKFWWLSHFSLSDPLGRFVSVTFCLAHCAALAVCFSALVPFPRPCSGEPDGSMRIVFIFCPSHCNLIPSVSGHGQQIYYVKARKWFRIWAREGTKSQDGLYQSKNLSS